MNTLSGPIFEPAQTVLWKSIHGTDGAHYNTFACETENGMAALRAFFPAAANEMNFVLFSTNGVHGHGWTIEDCEEHMARGNKTERGDEFQMDLTFLIVQPRLVCLRYGNCEPKNAEDIAFLKRLRASSWQAVAKVGG